MDESLESQRSQGLFGITEDYVDFSAASSQSLDQLLVKNKIATYFFRLQDTSMQPLMLPGDILIVDRSLNPSSGCFIIVEQEQQLICRQYFLKKQHVVLKSLSPARSTQINTQDHEQSLHIWGVVRGLTRELLPK